MSFKEEVKDIVEGSKSSRQLAQERKKNRWGVAAQAANRSWVETDKSNPRGEWVKKPDGGRVWVAANSGKFKDMDADQQTKALNDNTHPYYKKVKALLEMDKPEGAVRWVHQESQEAGTQQPDGGIWSVKSPGEGWERASGVVKKSRKEIKKGAEPTPGIGRAMPKGFYKSQKESIINNINKKVKDLLEAGGPSGKQKKKGIEDVNVARGYVTKTRKGGVGTSRGGDQVDVTGPVNTQTPEEVKRRAAIVKRLGVSPETLKRAAKRVARKSQGGESQSTTESTHPFYQRVKALARGKKNNSLLEKKSKSVKRLRFLMIRGGEKSKTDESLLGGAAAEVGAMGVRKLSQLWKDRKKSKEEKSKVEEARRKVKATLDDSGWRQASQERVKVRKAEEQRRKEAAEKSKQRPQGQRKDWLTKRVAGDDGVTHVVRNIHKKMTKAELNKLLDHLF
jgi:hypothetical protein